MPLRRRRRLRRRRIAGAAVIAGTAGAVDHQNEKHAEQDTADQAQYDQAYDEGAADAQAQQDSAPPPAPEEDLTAKLQELDQMHDSGALSDEEFAAAKQKTLGS